MQPMDPDAYIASVHRAYDDEPYPGDAEVIGCPDEECVYAVVGRRWQDVTSELLTSDVNIMFFLSDAGFHYYLPAYLIACLDQTAYHTLGDALILMLLPNIWGGALDLDVHNYMQQWPPEQLEALAGFLDIVRARGWYMQDRMTGEDWSGDLATWYREGFGLASGGGAEAP